MPRKVELIPTSPAPASAGPGAALPATLFTAADKGGGAGRSSASSAASPDAPTPRPRRETAETMATRQKDIAVSEFFAKNRHLLGFDNPRKALLTTVKEAVDNSLDACEEAGILPNITVIIEDLQPERGANVKASRYRVSVIDNGPGIVRKQVENVFGRLLFGSKFHRLKMSRGQQGIGISAAGMYGLITTGKPMVIHTKTKPRQPAHHIELAMNTKTNRAEVTVDDETDDFPPRRFSALTPGTRDASFLHSENYMTGTSVSVDLEGKYQKGRGSVDEFLELTAIANPHAQITFVPPTRVSSEEVDDLTLANAAKDATHADALTEAATHASKNVEKNTAQGNVDPTITTIEKDGVILFPRGTDTLPPETKEIQPHPKGIEFGILLQMLKDYEATNKTGTIYNFLQEQFSRISPAKAAEFCKVIGVHTRTRCSDITPPQAERLFKEFEESRLPAPPTDCLAPIGIRQLQAGLLKGVKAEFYTAETREPTVYRGRPFLVEAAIAFGGELPSDQSARVIRFANRVPLLFQQSACSSFKACTETSWRNYNLSQPRTALPVGPLVIMIHLASVWVPFTSESKEAIADYDEIRKEMKLALMVCGRKLGSYLRKRQKMQRETARRDVFERYIGEISKAVNAINGTETQKLYDALLAEARKRTAIADAKLDEEGKVLKKDEHEDLKEDDTIVLVESRAAHLQDDEADATSAEPSGAPEAARSGKAVAKTNDTHSPAGKGNRGAGSDDDDERNLF